MRLKRANAEASMSFLEHLDELRGRLIRILIALGAGVAVAFPFRNQLYNLLLLPQSIRIQNLLADFIAWFAGWGVDSHAVRFAEIWLRASASAQTPFTPIFHSPLEPFTTLFRLCIMAGGMLAFPFILYQIWTFVVPALKRTERRIAVRLGFLMGAFFFLGVFFAFFVATPLFLEMSANLWLSADIALPPQNLWTFDKYTGFLFLLTIAFGAAFELPLVMAFLSHLDVVRASTFREKRRLAYFILLVASALLTPGDVVPMLMMAFPLMGLYEFGILLAAFMGRRLDRRLEASLQESPETEPPETSEETPEEASEETEPPAEREDRSDRGEEDGS